MNVSHSLLIAVLDSASVQKLSSTSNFVRSLQTRLGEGVRTCRARLGVTQEELAARSELHRTYIADIERGGRNITLRTIANLAVALEVTVVELLAHVDGDSASKKKLEPVGPTPGIGEVLLVEDNAEDEELTLRAFSRATFANPVKVVRDGEEALAYLLPPGGRAEGEVGARPQLILLDLNLPKISGLEVLRLLKADDRTRTIPVVILTVSHHDQHIDECARLGAQNYILKPLNFDSFCRVASRLQFQWLLQQSGVKGALPSPN